MSITKLEAFAASELNVIVAVFAVELNAHTWIVDEITADHVPPAWTEIWEGKVIVNFPPEDGIEFLRTIVNLQGG